MHSVKATRQTLSITSRVNSPFPIISFLSCHHLSFRKDSVIQFPFWVFSYPYNVWFIFLCVAFSFKFLAISHQTVCTYINYFVDVLYIPLSWSYTDGGKTFSDSHFFFFWVLYFLKDIIFFSQWGSLWTCLIILLLFSSCLCASIYMYSFMCMHVSVCLSISLAVFVSVFMYVYISVCLCECCENSPQFFSYVVSQYGFTPTVLT